jgi:hypothetical protein
VGWGLSPVEVNDKPIIHKLIHSLVILGLLFGIMMFMVKAPYFCDARGVIDSHHMATIGANAGIVGSSMLNVGFLLPYIVL